MAGVPLETVVNRMRLIAEPEKDEEFVPKPKWRSGRNIQAPRLDDAPVRRFTDAAPSQLSSDDLRLGRRTTDPAYKPPVFGGRQ